MRNRADNPYRSRARPARVASDWGLDRRPEHRLAILLGAIVMALVTVASRLVYVQGCLTERFAAEFDRTTEQLEEIPSHDGRILAADGEVLAEDREIFGVKVHYRWLEEPPDPTWLRGQALMRLDRPARRDPQRVAREIERVRERRTQLWHRLAGATGLDPRTLAGRRREIQRRVEHVYELVERRRAARIAEASAEASTDANAATAWDAIRQTVVGTLTTPPVREAVEPLVIREQLDYHVVVSDVPLETAVEVEAHPELYPGTRIAVTTRRVYPQGDCAPHLVGYRTPIDQAVLEERARRFPHGDPLDYRPSDRVGKTGLERYYERHLRGLRGVRKLVLDRRGEVLRSETLREPRFGHDLVLSLNLPLQRAAEELLDDVLSTEHADETNGKPLPIPPGGAIVALDARTGSVLAAASAPRFDLRLLVDPDREAWERLLADPRKPLFHRAAEMALPPGSVFKVVSAVAFLESGRIDPGREFHCQGYLDDPDHYRCLIYRQFGAAHGAINLVDALARSCNVYFFSAARRIGATPISQWAARFGFGQPTGLDLPGERAGNLPLVAQPAEPATGTSRRPQISGDVLQLAIGQARLTATPLQVARLVAAVANGGKLVTPRLVDSSGPVLLPAAESGGDTLESSAAPPIPGLSPRTLEWVRLGMAHVVSDRHGTGFKTVRLHEIAIAGKTGTAESGGGRPDHAWFAGYVPAERPRIAFVVVLENAGAGGHAAGPVARKFVQAMLAAGLVDRRALSAPSAN
jgi:penicillin-binding protein 2